MLVDVSHQLPPDDQPDEIWVGPVGPIPIQYEDDPRLASERTRWHDANVRSQAMLTADELLGGLEDEEWRVRVGVVERLVARAGSDERTVPSLIDTLLTDTAWQVRDAVAMALKAFPGDGRVLEALRTATADENDEVRWSVGFALAQLEAGP
jgi:HEAT repeat protein